MFYSHRLHTYLDSIHFVVATWSSVLAVCKHAKHEVARTCHGLTDARTRPIVSRYNREREREREREKRRLKGGGIKVGEEEGRPGVHCSARSCLLSFRSVWRLVARRPSASSNSMKCLQPLRFVPSVCVCVCVWVCGTLSTKVRSIVEVSSGLQPIANIHGYARTGRITLFSEWRAPVSCSPSPCLDVSLSLASLLSA